MTAALVKYETIDEGQIDDLMARRPVREPEGWSEDGTSKTRLEKADPAPTGEEPGHDSV